MLFLCSNLTAKADGDSEFLLFLHAEYLDRYSVDQSSIQTDDFTPAADFLFSHVNGRWRIVGEYFLTDDESELERLQIGYDLSEDSTFWVGRFHQPISAWNHRYHHGAYLQPSISRPAIENWEDETGILPSHSTGFMLDTWRPLSGQSGIRYAASLGIAPILDDGVLEPFDILNPSTSSGKPAASVNISYFPDFVAESNIGIIGGYAEILAEPVPSLGIDSRFEIVQTLLGAQIVWERNQWQLISAAYYVNNDPAGTTADVGGWFIAGYGQALRTVSENTNAYFRIERTKNARAAGYLSLFPDYVIQREILGFRYDFANRQAVAIEISGNKVIGDDYQEIRVQWSAAFP